MWRNQAAWWRQWPVNQLGVASKSAAGVRIINTENHGMAASMAKMAASSWRLAAYGENGGGHRGVMAACGVSSAANHRIMKIHHRGERAK